MVYCHQALKEETQKTQRLSGGLTYLSDFS